MCEDDTHNKGKPVRKSDCVACTPSLICPHGSRTCNKCNPGVTDRNNLTTRNNMEKGFFYGYTAAEFLALEEKEKCDLNSKAKIDLQGRAEIESCKEGKRKLLRSAKRQVEALCCTKPEAITAIEAFLKPHDARIFADGRPDTFAINGMACSGGAESTTAEVLSNVIRPTQKGPFTSTDGKLRKFTHDAQVDLQFLVKKHKEDIAKGKTFVDSRHDAVLGCVFHTLPTKELSGGFAEGRMYETGLISWIRGQSCKDLNRNRGGGGATPNAVENCGGSAWFTAGLTEEVVCSAS
jgi:hypothetical protein